MEQPIRIRSQPGIKRDGTQFEGSNYSDGQWVRFQRGLPRKIGGYRVVTSTLPEIARGLTSYSANGMQFLHLGGEEQLTQVTTNSLGTFGGQSDRTPAAFAIDANNLWQFDVLFDSAGGNTPVLIAHAAPNLTDISSQTETPIYYGNMTAATALVDTGAPSESGGIVVLAPYIMKFGNAGHISLSMANDPTDFTAITDAWVTGQKIVKGLPLRGGGSGPSGLLWSLDSLVRATFTSPTDGYFAFDTITGESSILSSQSVVEYDGIYFWAGVDRFLMFNGIVREVPNNMNQNWFYDGLNYAYAQKVFAFKVPRWGEIWWCYPRGDATECTHAVIYNVRENTWYDTELPGSGRSIGQYAKVYSKPFMVDLDETATGFTLWQHETGTDAINGALIEPILSRFRTADISMLTGEQAQNKSIHVGRIEPDFVQVGSMTVRVNGRANARATLQEGELFTFPDVATTPEEQIVNVKEVRRLMQFEFESNAVNGNYQMGECLAHVEPADGRVTQ